MPFGPRVLLTAFVGLQIANCSFHVNIDPAADIALSPLGQVGFYTPKIPATGNPIPLLPQPFKVVLSASLYPSVDYTDWAMCYTIDDGEISPFCVTFIVNEGSVSFEPVPDTIEPTIDGLNASTQHHVIAYFQSLSHEEKRWGLSECPFEVTPSVPKHANGQLHIVENDAGDLEQEDDVMLIDGVLDIKPNAGHETFKTTMSVCGVLIDAHDNPKEIASAIRNVALNLPMVRPIHLFHQKNLMRGCDYSLELSSDQLDLCSLVDMEAVVSHPLTVKSLSPRDYSALLKSRVLWSRIKGSDKALFFSTKGAACSRERGDNASPRLIRDFSAFDYLECRTARSASKLSGAYTLADLDAQGDGVWSLRNVAMMTSCASEFGLVVGDEPEDVFFPRCVTARGGLIANSTYQDQFCASAHRSEVAEDPGRRSLVVFDPDIELIPHSVACAQFLS